MKLLLLVLFSLVLTSCSTVQSPFEPESFKKGLYRKDMKLAANSYSGHGVLVIPKSKKYKMNVKAIGKLDLFTVTSCHREITQEDAGYKGRFLGFGKDSRLAKMEFIPAKGLEDSGSCPIEFGGYEKKRGRHSWGILVAEHDGATLPSKVHCNGRDAQYRGVSICQSRAGLVQKIEFPTPVVYNLDKACKYTHVKLIDGKTFEYRMPEGECLIYFQEIGDSARISEHYDYGYSKIIIEGS